MRVRTILAIVAAAAIAGGAWWWQDQRPRAVETVAATTGTAAAIVYASGVVEPKTWSKVTSLVRERIVEVCSCEGETVAAGQLLVRLDDSEVRASRQQLDARRVLARQELSRSADLLSRDVGSRQAWERTTAALAEIEASLAAVNEKANDHLVTAPIDGQVLRLDASVGEIAEPGEVLAWVGRPTPLEVIAEVNEEDIPRVVPGQKVLLKSDAFPDRVLDASVGSITPKGDPVQKTYRVRLALPADTPLFIGMTVDANIVTTERANAVLVPSAAVRGDQVFVLENGRVVSRAVRPGIRGLASTEILEGLAAGEPVVSPVPDDLRSGDRVTTEDAS